MSSMPIYITTDKLSIILGFMTLFEPLQINEVPSSQHAFDLSPAWTVFDMCCRIHSMSDGADSYEGLDEGRV